MRDALGAVQSVLVLGGTSEIGLAIARELAAPRGARVVLAGRDPEAMRAAAGDLPAALMAFDADAVEEHERVIGELWEAHGDLDVVVLAFGVLGDQERGGGRPREVVRVLRTNLLGAASVAAAVAERLRAQGHGTLVVLSSVAGERARASNYVYGASKAGLDAFAQGLGDALHDSGVGVLIVRPGFVRTRMTAGLKPAPLATTPEAVAHAVRDGLSRGAQVVWVPRALRLVMVVLRHLPRPLFRRLDL